MRVLGPVPTRFSSVTQECMVCRCRAVSPTSASGAGDGAPVARRDLMAMRRAELKPGIA
jgi:hypothetical protein